MAAEIRSVDSSDARALVASATLLDRFNRDYDCPTPGVGKLTERVRVLIEGGDTTVLLAGDGPDGVLVLRMRPALWSDSVEPHVQELYVLPEARRRGYGRAMMERAIELAREAGAEGIDLGTEEDDTAARALYESLGFTNRDRGALMFFYELEL